MYFKRTLEDTVLDYSKKFPIVYLEGPCKVGKASLLKQIKDSKLTTLLGKPRRFLPDDIML